MKHVHAELIKLYAEQLLAWVVAGADFAKHPAQHWEREDGTDNWYRYSTTHSPAFAESVQYRYNPLPKTVTRYLNDGTKIELPEPCHVVVAREKYWLVRADGTVMEDAHMHSSGRNFLVSGNCYRTEADAKQWARYLKHIRTGEPMEIANESNR